MYYFHSKNNVSYIIFSLEERLYKYYFQLEGFRITKLPEALVARVSAFLILYRRFATCLVALATALPPMN